MHKGECNCGNVSYEVDKLLTGVVICHCSICRRSTGSNGIAVVVANKSDFRWTKGRDNVTTWIKPEHDWQSSFCKTCGANLPGENDEVRMYIPAGSLIAPPEDLRVTHHIWTDSKACWDTICDNGKQHKQAFEG